MFMSNDLVNQNSKEAGKKWSEFCLISRHIVCSKYVRCANTWHIRTMHLRSVCLSFSRAQHCERFNGNIASFACHSILCYLLPLFTSLFLVFFASDSLLVRRSFQRAHTHTHEVNTERYYFFRFFPTRLDTLTIAERKKRRSNKWFRYLRACVLSTDERMCVCVCARTSRQVAQYTCRKIVLAVSVPRVHIHKLNKHH